MTEYVIDYKKNGHGIRVEKVSGKLKVMKDGKVLADSRNAMILEEDGLLREQAEDLNHLGTDP